tara:strand:- start:108 stop:425 length:318 start_codon:yes stop_codon:yes gene_type:complete
VEFARVLSEELDLIPTFLLIIYLDLDVNNTFKNAKRASVSSSWRHMLEIANNRALAFIGMWLGSDARKVVRQRPGNQERAVVPTATGAAIYQQGFHTWQLDLSSC